jgi:hypothetical protein
MRALTAALLNGDLAGAARMKLLLSVVAILAATSMLGASAQAQNYPWCAQYCGGGLNCGFVSFEQCMDTVRGIGGFCIRNNRYQPPPGPHPPTRIQRRAERNPY